ncbi:MAG: alpha/beta hydrolase [Gemmataceae bacterium]
MNTKVWLGVWVGLLLWAVLPAAAPAQLLRGWRYRHAQKILHGCVVDHTDHNDGDYRIWSPTLCQKRSLYVYLPPGYDPCQQYPLIVWLHGFMENERAFPDRVLPPLDQAIVEGRMPPAIIAAPSGAIPGRPGSMFLNTNYGRYEDYVVHDIMEFLFQHYPIRPEREAHVLMGLSSGAWAAYCIAIRHRDLFGNVVGILPPLNPLYLDCHCRYRNRDFDPCCWAQRTELRRRFELVGIYYGLPITFYRQFAPYWGWGDKGLARVSDETALYLLDRHDVQPGELNMLAAYIRQDNLNVDAQVESFLYYARCCKGLCVDVIYRLKGGGHNIRTGLQFLPKIADWIGLQLAPFHPHHCGTEEERTGAMIQSDDSSP